MTAAARRGSANVFVHSLKGTLEAIATETRSSRSGEDLKRSSAERVSR